VQYNLKDTRTLSGIFYVERDLHWQFKEIRRCTRLGCFPWVSGSLKAERLTRFNLSSVRDALWISWTWVIRKIVN